MCTANGNCLKPVCDSNADCNPDGRTPRCKNPSIESALCSKCSVDGKDGDGTKRGYDCVEGKLCVADGSC